MVLRDKVMQTRGIVASVIRAGEVVQEAMVVFDIDSCSSRAVGCGHLRAREVPRLVWTVVVTPVWAAKTNPAETMVGESLLGAVTT